MDLSTLERVKTVLKFKPGVDTPDQDAQLLQLLAAVSAHAEKLMDRVTLIGNQVEILDARCEQRVFSLRAYPVVSISEVLEDSGLGDFSTSATIPTANHRLNKRNGIVMLAWWDVRGGSQSIRVTYNGGMASSSEAFAVAYPDIAGAIDLQVAMQYRRLPTLGTSGTNFGQGGSVQLAEKITWLPTVLDVIGLHSRYVVR